METQVDNFQAGTQAQDAPVILTSDLRRTYRVGTNQEVYALRGINITNPRWGMRGSKRSFGKWKDNFVKLYRRFGSTHLW